MFLFILKITIALLSIATTANAVQPTENTQKYHKLLKDRMEFPGPLNPILVTSDSEEMSVLKQVSEGKVEELQLFAKEYELPFIYEVNPEFWKLSNIKGHYIYTYSILITHKETEIKTSEEQCTAILSPLTGHLTFCTGYTL